MTPVLLLARATGGTTVPELLIALALWFVVGGGVGVLIGRWRRRPVAGLVLGLMLLWIGWLMTAALPRPQRYGGGIRR